METKDNTRMPLYLEVKGTKPIPGSEQKMATLKQELALLKLGITINYDKITLSERVATTGEWNPNKAI